MMSFIIIGRRVLNSTRFYSSSSVSSLVRRRSNNGSNRHEEEEGGQEEGTGNPLSTDLHPNEEQRRVFHKASKEHGWNVEWINKLVYSSYLLEFQPKRSFRYRLSKNALKPTVEAVERVGKNLASAPASWKFLDEEGYRKAVAEDADLQPSSSSYKTTNANDSSFFPFKDTEEKCTGNPRLESEAERLAEAGVDLADVFDEGREGDVEYGTIDMSKEIGTPDIYVKPSNVPCGGCGAHLHCQDVSIPGYIPSERFKSLGKKLKGQLCLRCHCLENYNTALNVNVRPEEYPSLMQQIRKYRGVALIVVDLTDFPCSVWPEIMDIIGTGRPVILVGNKVDLIPRDADNYLQRIEECLYETARKVGLSRAKIMGTVIVSAETGFGIEDLVSKIYKVWDLKGNGDLFIMGCCNVGKSSLFNALLKSDLCKAKATDLVQRATISRWPGTTLNLLKFPVQSLNRIKTAYRNQRLTLEAPEKMDAVIERNRKIRDTGDPDCAVLSEGVGRTLVPSNTAKEIIDPIILEDPFLYTKHIPKKIPKTGEWDPKDPDLAGNWCFDTPGSVNENQFLDVLTLPELIKVLTRKIIKPRTYFIKKGISFFLGGLVRLDYQEGLKPIRYTVFSSDQLPVSMVQIQDADYFYKEALGSPVLGVPEGNSERLSKFPSLLPTDFSLQGEGHRFSCGDIVLSSTGWIAVTAGHEIVKLRVHTPGGKGVFLRTPSMLPLHVNLKGVRIRGTYAYMPPRVFVPSKSATY